MAQFASDRVGGHWRALAKRLEPGSIIPTEDLRVGRMGYYGRIVVKEGRTR